MNVAFAPESLNSLRFARYEFHLVCRQDVALPPFLGSTLRGAFGHALKESVCVIPHRDCSRCMLAQRCPYPRLFEPGARSGAGLLNQSQDAPRPFIFVPPLTAAGDGPMYPRDHLLRWRVGVRAQEPLVFALALVGDANDDLPYFINAIRAMAGKGFGVERAPFQLEKVCSVSCQGERKTIFTADSPYVQSGEEFSASLGAFTRARMFQIVAKEAETTTSLQIDGSPHSNISDRTAQGRALTAMAQAFPTPGSLPLGSVSNLSIGNSQSLPGTKIRLRFITPTRIRIKGQVVESLTCMQLIKSLSLRISMITQMYDKQPLNYNHTELLERARDVSTRESTLRLMTLDRFSNRQQTKLAIDGFLGDVTFSGSEVRQLLPIIVAGEFLHIGSGTAFGMGRYVILN